MKKLLLPPLNSLVAFEAAGRHLSFTRAALELCVTQGAVSRQVRHLEEHLQCHLFIRNKTQLRLTPEGAEYYQGIEAALQQISRVTVRTQQRQDNLKITVVSTFAMASLWLLPRLQDFQHRFPDIEVQIMAVDAFRQFQYSEYDLALLYCRYTPGGVQAIRLFDEQVFPVCSPHYLTQYPNLNQANKLLECTLLTLDTREEWVTWRDWFHALGLQRLIKMREVKMNNYLLIIQAALNGQGVALAWKSMVEQYLQSGLLVRPVEAVVKTNAAFYLLRPPIEEEIKSNAASVESFAQWVLGNLAQDKA